METPSNVPISERITRRQCVRMLTAATGAGLVGCVRQPALDELVFPEDDWEEAEPKAMGIDPIALEAAIKFLADEAGEEPWRVVITRFGRLVTDRGNVEADKHYKMASICKSVYTSMLGIAISEGKIGSLDDKLIDYYPEIQEATGEFGPYSDRGRFFSEDDRDVTFRHLATHTGGFMRAGEAPGTAWTYDTMGMSTLMHTIAKQYGYYDSKILIPKRNAGMVN